MTYSNKDREELIATMKAAGKMLINNAESIMGENTDYLSNFKIWINLDPGSGFIHCEVTQEYDIPPYSERNDK